MEYTEYVEVTDPEIVANWLEGGGLVEVNNGHGIWLRTIRSATTYRLRGLESDFSYRLVVRDELPEADVVIAELLELNKNL